MALQVATGQILSPTSTGNQTYLGLGFQPKAIFYFTNRYGDGLSGGDVFYMIGWDAVNNEGTNGHSRAAFIEDNAATTSTVNGFSPGSVGLMQDNVAATALNNSLVAFETDGFTLNWSTVEATSRAIQYLAIGSSGLSAFSGAFLTGTGTSNIAVTGVGFQPKIVFFLSSAATSAAGWSATTPFHMCFGAATSSSARWSAGVLSRDAQAAADNDQRIESSSIQYIMQAGGTIGMNLDFVSMDADGFTVDPVTAYTSNTQIAYLALGGDGLVAALGIESQKTSSGTKSTTGTGFQPQVLLFSGNSATTVGTAPGGMAGFFGVAADASTDQRVCAISETDAADPTVARGSTTSGKALRYISGITPTTDAEAEVDSLDADGYTLNWTTADGTARLFGWIALAEFTTTAVSGDATWKLSATASAPRTALVIADALYRWSAAAVRAPIYAFNLFCAFLMRSTSSEEVTVLNPPAETPVSGSGGGFGSGSGLGGNMYRRTGWYRRVNSFWKRRG